MLTKLEQLMACPVDWSPEFPHDEAWRSSFPYLDWYYCLSQCAVDGDDLPYYPEDFEWFSDPPEELQRVIINLDERRPSAVELYMRRAGRLKGLTFLRPTDHGKHFVGDVDLEELKRRTQRGPSLFLSNYESDRLEQSFWYWVQMYFEVSQSRFDLSPPLQYQHFMKPESEQYSTPEARLWRGFLIVPHMRIVLNTIKPVGASSGQMTSFICYDVHLDSKIVHCYPVSEADAKVIMGNGDVFVDDSFQ